MKTYHVPEASLRSSQDLIHVTLTTMLWGGGSHYPCFIAEETSTERLKNLPEAPRSHQVTPGNDGFRRQGGSFSQP